MLLAKVDVVCNLSERYVDVATHDYRLWSVSATKRSVGFFCDTGFVEYWLYRNPWETCYWMTERDDQALDHFAYYVDLETSTKVIVKTLSDLDGVNISLDLIRQVQIIFGQVDCSEPVDLACLVLTILNCLEQRGVAVISLGQDVDPGWLILLGWISQFFDYFALVKIDGVHVWVAKFFNSVGLLLTEEKSIVKEMISERYEYDLTNVQPLIVQEVIVPRELYLPTHRRIELKRG